MNAGTKTRLTTLLASLLMAVSGAMHAEKVRDLTVHDPWIREVPPVSERSAGYLRIDNTGNTDRALVAADSDRFERVELHESRESDDGVMRMIHLDQLPLPAGETTALAPGGYHIMLIDRVGEPLSEAAGDTVTIRLMFDNDQSTEVEARVLRYGPDDDNADHGMDH